MGTYSMEVGFLVYPCHIVIVLLLCWISTVQGASSGFPCTSSNCTSPGLGEPCFNHTDCWAISYSQCRDETCQCGPGYSSSDNRTCGCLAGYRHDGVSCIARKLGDECSDNADCSAVMNNTRCANMKCVCINNYSREDDRTCRPRRRNLGDSCNNNRECILGGRKFRLCRDNRCICKDGYKQVNDSSGDGSCVQRDKLGDACLSSNNCSSIPGGGVCRDGICQCRHQNRKPSASNETCEAILLNDACQKDTNCQHVNNSQCVNNICVCVGGFVSNGSKLCTEIIVEDTKCNSTEDCLQQFPYTVCGNTGFCQCEPLYHLSARGSACLFRYIGDSCSNDAECRHSVQNSQCDNTTSTCQCKATYTASSDKTGCRLKELEGKPCTSDAECILASSSCDFNSSTCSCDVGYISNADFNECQEKQLFGPCLSDAECTTTNANTLCNPVVQRCECLPAFIPIFRSDVNSSLAITPSSEASKPFCSRRRIGVQSCQIKEDCSSAIANSNCGSCHDAPEESPCLQRCQQFPAPMRSLDTLDLSTSCPELTCVCEKGFRASSDGERCERIQLLDTCQRDEDCSNSIPNSHCWNTSYQCHCLPGFRAVGFGGCTKLKIGDDCTNNYDCEIAVTSSHCTSELSTGKTQGYPVCKCNAGHQVNQAGSECRKRRIGDQCQTDSDCRDAVNNSNCHYNMCVCTIGYYSSYDHRQCNKRKLYDDYCENNRSCSVVLPNAFCRNSRCVCESGYLAEKDTECRRRNINDFCRLPTDCSDAVSNSTCISGICGCASGFVAMGTDTCVRRRIFDSTCVNPRDCSDAVGNSSCKNRTCVCDTGYYPSRDRTACFPRKLNDSCNETHDCLGVIENSNCVSGRCACLEFFDAHANDSRCVSRPKIIGDPCHYDEQCRKVHPVSTCIVQGNEARCFCPRSTFVALNRSVCITLPTAVGEPCTHDRHCNHTIKNSVCNFTCTCSQGYFADYNRTICHRDPEKLGDFCHQHDQCNKAMANSECEDSNNTCICTYGYTQSTAKSCVERERLPVYKQVKTPTATGCQQKKCSAWTNSLCVTSKAFPEGLCQCDFRYARSFDSTQCVPVQTYVLDLSLVREAMKYDYGPLNFTLDPDLVLVDQPLAIRITVSGLMELFNKTTSSSPLKDRYVASEVTSVKNLDETNKTTDKGAKVSVLLNLTANYLDATRVQEIYNFIVENLIASGGLLGGSLIQVATPYSKAVVIRDYDECEINVTIRRNDCSDKALCINTLGSYMCVCKSRYEDTSKAQGKRQGRVCSDPSKTDDSSDLCSSGGCQTRWEFVGLALTLFLLVVIVFIVYEIIQRKQMFTARKLYEKFGTTKIRKLRHASMQRLQERKKRKKEEVKTKKEEEKQKKEELKREKSEKKRLKDDERKAKQKEKKQKDLEKKEAKRMKQAKSSNDVEWLGEEEDRDPASPGEATTPATSSPCPATDDSPSAEVASLPGSVNSPDIQMTFPKMVASPIEESNV